MNLGWVNISDVDHIFEIALKEDSIEAKPDTKYKLWFLTVLTSSQAYILREFAHSLNFRFDNVYQDRTLLRKAGI